MRKHFLARGSDSGGHWRSNWFSAQVGSLAQSTPNQARPVAQPADRDSQHDFDFEIGTWGKTSQAIGPSADRLDYLGRMRWHHDRPQRLELSGEGPVSGEPKAYTLLWGRRIDAAWKDWNVSALRWSVRWAHGYVRKIFGKELMPIKVLARVPAVFWGGLP